MPILVPNDGEIEFFNLVLNQALTLRIFGNNHTPALGDTLASLTEISGGGYASINLTFANWTIVGGSPSVALYNSFQIFNFTGAVAGPGTCYGYYVRTPSGRLLVEQRFDPADLPFVPINGSQIRVKPRITLRPEP